MPKIGNLKVKIKIIPPKIVEVKNEESLLEKEVESFKKEEPESFTSASSGNFQASILASSESPQEPVERIINNAPQRTETGFSQTRVYASKGQDFSAQTQRRNYESEGASRRFTASLPSNQDGVSSQNVNFERDATNRMHGNAGERDYNKPIDLAEVKQQRRKMPWE